MQIDAFLESRREEMVDRLCALIAMPSLEEDARPGQPFGAPLYECLNATLEMARGMGFTRCENVDGYAGYIEMGQGDEEVGILAHLDVVPPGDGWTLPPFEGTVKDGRVYGRGSSDNKGGVIASLYAMAALLPVADSFHKRVRLILGCSEETGMTCIDHYLMREPMPDYGFSPDASYPLINTEKGIQDVHGLLTAPPTETGLRLVSLSAGQRPNVIPGKATAVLHAPEPEVLRAAFDALVQAHPEKENIALTLDGQTATLTCQGVVGHASTPQQGRNAAGLLLSVLAGLPLTDGPREQAVRDLARLVGDSYDGLRLGVACQDEISGALTCNLGLLHTTEEGVAFTLDIRYPVCMTQKTLLDTLEAAFADTGFAIQAGHGYPPHHVDENAPLVQKLLAVYAEQTGRPAYCMAIGGGTYARKLPGRAVAFGMEFPGEPATAHMADEFLSINDLMTNARIIAHAIQALAVDPW